jgi:hypothetical protein
MLVSFLGGGLEIFMEHSFILPWVRYSAPCTHFRPYLPSPKKSPLVCILHLLSLLSRSQACRRIPRQALTPGLWLRHARAPHFHPPGLHHRLLLLIVVQSGRATVAA